MAGQLKIGGNVIATHAGTEGAGTVTLDSSALTIGSNTTIQGTMNAGSIGTAVTMSANQPAVKTALNASGSAPIFACRAWVNFNGTGTVVINGSGNVSSITDNGTADYTVNFTTAFDDINYSVAGSCVGSTSGNYYSFIVGTSADLATSNIKIRTLHVSGNQYDQSKVHISIFR